MRRLAFLLIFLVSFQVAVLAQFGDEWINYNQQYYKINVADDALYRITFNDLQAAGFPLASVDPRRIQLFYRGIEQAIFVEGQNDASFDPTDYIEFYGKKNDGTLDQFLYEPASTQPHAYYNLFSDTAAYFLTWNNLAVPGKRMTLFFENNTSGIPAENFHNENYLRVLADQYSTGTNVIGFLQYSWFDEGEGWTGQIINEGTQRDYTLSGLLNTVQTGAVPQLELLLVGRFDANNRAEVYVGPNAASLRLLGTHDLSRFSNLSVNHDLNWTDIGADGNMVVRVRSVAFDGPRSRLSASYIQLHYPQQFNQFNSTKKKYYLRENPSNKSFIQISNTILGTRLFDITDTDNVIRVGTTSTATLNAVINNTATERKILAVSQVSSTNIKSVKLRRVQLNQQDYVMITHPLLRQPAGAYTDPVLAYAAYRASAAGGSYDTLLINIEQLYNQYTYGEVSPLAIYRFVDFLASGTAPKYLFLVGKGLDVSLNYHRSNPASFVYKDLVPSSGMPGSDILYTAGIGTDKIFPRIPVGRLTVMESAQVAAYLDKVKEMEVLPYDALWRKNILHLSGGISGFELNNFKNIMQGFGNVAENIFLGGKVNLIAKRSTDVVENINVAEQINQGMNLVTFFGHSAPDVTDIDIGYVSDPLLGYNNPGKYPMFLINGCNAGTFFANRNTFGEDWVHTASKGAIGFVAHSSFGFPFELRKYTTLFYETAYGDSTFVYKGVGDVQKLVAEKYHEGITPQITTITQVQQMVLLGDPAVKVFGADKPDYEINNQSLSITSFDGSQVTALSDSFAIKIVIRNFGMAINEQLLVRLTRTFADNSVESYDSLFSPVLYSDTLLFKVRRTANSGFGNNTFRIELDPDLQIQELSKTNNTAELNTFISLNATKNLYPLPYAVLNQQVVRLLVQSSNLMAPERNFEIELDTAFNFNSPFLQQYNLTASVLANVDATLLSTDSTVYFWRSRLSDPGPNESNDWQLSTFSYIMNSTEAWGQINFDQLFENGLNGLLKDPALKTFNFEETELHIELTTYGSDHPAGVADLSVRIDGLEYIIDNGRRCRKNALNLIAFNRSSLVPYAGIPFIFQDNRSCGRQPQIINNYTLTELENLSEGIIAWVDNIALNDSVLLFSFGDAGFQNWSAAVKAKIGELGISATQIEALENGEPVIIWGRKGATPGTAIIERVTEEPKIAQMLFAEETLTGSFSSGSLSSVLIGPAQEWLSLDYQAVISELPQTDVVEVSITGISLNGAQQLLIGNASVAQDLSSINAADFPYLRLRFFTEDEVNLTPAQLRHWIISFTPVPEGIILPGSFSSPLNLQEGEEGNLAFGFLNISDKVFSDSLQVNYETVNAARAITDKQTLKILAPAPGDTTQFNVPILTNGKAGSNDFNVFVNPRLLREQFYENNNLSYPALIQVSADQTNPLIDVLIDGRYILDGEIVSPEPFISIRLKDENQFLLKTDTLDFDIFIKAPCEACVFKRINFSSSEVVWFASSVQQDFRVEYHPRGLEDGIYTLRIEAKDASGNPAGSEPYQIRFEVVNESSISNFYPYPNPFSSNTRFIFTLTGSVIPDQIKIQIMTISGKIVREITQDELGPIRIGNNISDYSWDGRDEFGDQLANGVYLYRVIVRANGEQLKLRSTSGDRGFEKGIGKMYLLR